MSQKLRIAVWHYLPSGGGKRALYDQVRGLVGRGHEVEIWCPEQSERSFLSQGLTVREHRVPLAHVWGRRQFRCLGSVMDTWQTKRDLRALEEHCRICAEEMNAGSFDVVMGHPSELFYMHPLGRFTQSPTLLYLQEVYRPLYEARPHLVWEAPDSPKGLKGGLQGLRRSVGATFRMRAMSIQVREERRAAREYTRILVNSFFSRESVVRTYSVDADVCYLGVDTDHFTPDHEPKEDFLMGLGSLTFAKGAHFAIEALGHVPKPKRLPLVWVGNIAEKNYWAFCSQLAEKLEVIFRVEKLIEEKKLLNLLRRARLLLYPSVLEPFGFAPLEANACGTPVLAIAEGGLRETIRDGVNGVLIPSRTPERWASVIQAVLADSAAYYALCQTSRTYVERQWGLKASIDRIEAHLVQASRLKDGAIRRGAELEVCV